MNRFVPLSALLAVSVAFAQTLPASSPPAIGIEQELVRRALGSDFGPISVQAQLLVGQLPFQPLGPLPNIPSGRLLGSVVRTSSTPDFSSQSIFFDSSIAPNQILVSLKTSLQSQGWTPFRGTLGSSLAGGFQAAENPEILAYYRLEQQVSFNAQIRRVGTVTQVTLNLNKDRNLREQIQFRERIGGKQQINLPALRPPSDTTVQPSGTSGGGGSWTSYAVIQSRLKSPQLLQAYGKQLQAAGWTQLTSNTMGKTVTSVWRFVDEDKNDVTGVLILREDGPGRYSAQLVSLAFRN